MYFQSINESCEFNSNLLNVLRTQIITGYVAGVFIITFLTLITFQTMKNMMDAQNKYTELVEKFVQFMDTNIIEEESENESENESNDDTTEDENCTRCNDCENDNSSSDSLDNENCENSENCESGECVKIKCINIC